MSQRMLKELRNLTPWQWDTRALQHPPGAKSLSAFEKIDQAFLGSGGKTRSVSDAAAGVVSGAPVQGLKRAHRSLPAPAEAKTPTPAQSRQSTLHSSSGGTLTFHRAPTDQSPELHTPAVTCRITSPSTPLPAPSSPLTKPRSTPPPAASRCSAASDQPELLRLTVALDSQGPTPAHSDHHPAASYGTMTTSPPAFHLAPSGCPSALTSPPPCPSPCSSACPGARGLKRGSEACSQPPQQVKVEGAAALSPAGHLLLAHTTPSQQSKRPRPCTSCTPGDSAVAASDTTACQLLLHGPGCPVPGARGWSSRGDGSMGGGSRGVEGCSAEAILGQQGDSLAVWAPARQQGGSSGSEQEVGGSCGVSSAKLPCAAVLEVGVPRAGLTQCLEAAAAAPCEQGDGGEGNAGAGEVVQQQQESAFVASRPGTGQTPPGTKLTNPTPNCLAPGSAGTCPAAHADPPSPSSTSTAGAQRHLLDSLLQPVSTQASTTAEPAEPTVPLSSRAASPSPACLPLGHFCVGKVHVARMDSMCSPTAATVVAAAAGLPATSSEDRSGAGLDREAGRCPCEQVVNSVAAAPTDPCHAVLVQQQSQQAAEQQQREDAAACLMSLAAAPHAVKAVEVVAPSPGCAAGPPPWLGPSVACLGNGLPAQLHGPSPYNREPAAKPAQQLGSPLAPLTAAHVQVQQLVQLLTRLQQVGQVPGGLATAHQLLVQQAMQQQKADRVYQQNQPLQLSQPTQQQQLRRYGDCEALDAPAVSRGCAEAVAKDRDRVHPPPNQPPAFTKRTARAPHLPPGQAVLAVHHEVEARPPFGPAAALPQQGRGGGAEQRLGNWQCLPGPASSPPAMLPPATLPAAATCSPHTASKSPTPAAAPAPGGASASSCASSRLPGSALVQPPSSALLALLTQLPCPITPQAPPAAAAAAAPTIPAPPASSPAPLPDLPVALPPLAAPSPAAPPPLLPQPPQASAAGQGLGGGITLHDLVQAVSGYCTAQGVAPTPGNVLKAQAVVQLLQEADVPGASTILQQLQQQAGQELAAAACGAEGRGVKAGRQGGPDMLVTPAVVGTLAAPTKDTGADVAAHPSPAAAVAAGLAGPVSSQGTAAASVLPVAAVVVAGPTWPAIALPLLPLHIAVKPDIHADWDLSLHPAIVKVYADLQAAHSALRAACRPPGTHILTPTLCSPAPLLAPAASRLGEGLAGAPGLAGLVA